MVAYYRLRELGFRLPAGASIIPKEEFRPVEDASALLAEAEARAREIVAGAEAAYQRECERGYQDGLARANLEAAERLLRESDILDAKLRDVEHDLANVVAASVRKLTDTFDDVARAEAVVRGALKEMRKERRAELRVAPEQLAHFRAAIGRIISEFPEVELVDVVEDSSLQAPQVVLETSVGRVEGDFGRTIDELERAIKTATARQPDRASENEAERT